jgi:hypothetical protein
VSNLACSPRGPYPDAMIRTARGNQFGLAHPRGLRVRGQTRVHGGREFE